jgi:RHS repeat-associated protein
VAVIENASYSDVSLLLGSSFIRYYNPWDTPDSGDISAFNGLRSDLSDAHVTVMEWQPGIGIKKMTDPSGVVTEWSYDDAGRLQYVKDASQNTLDAYVYNLYNNGGDGRLSVRHKHYRSGSVYTDDFSYWNTLGQKLEDIAVRGSGDGQKTLVTAYEGDYLLHDDVKTWLPYPITATTGNFVTNAASASSSYHSNNKSYYHKGYEQSSRDIVTTTAVPGYAGVHDNVESIESVTGFPNLVWTDGVGIEGTTEIYRSRNIVEKRSVDADGRRHSQFVHPIGLLLATSWGSATPASTDPAPTYHVYDQYDRLRAVVGSGIALTDTLNMWRYSYDALDRLRSKGIPGAQREFYTYDSEDNVISISCGDELREMEYNDFGQVTKVYFKKGTAARVLMEEHEYGNGGLETYAKLAEVDGDGAVTGYSETTFTYDSKARLTSAVTVDVLGGTLQENYTYTYSGEVASHTTSYTHGTITDALTQTLTYDIRGRQEECTSTLSLGGTPSSSVTTEYSYDALGRPSGSSSVATVSGNNGTVFVTTDTYSLQGWLKSHSAKRGTQALYTESLDYDSPASTSGANALYTGMIAARSDQWKFTNYSLPETSQEGYLYDNGGRLSAVTKGGLTKNYYYDARGNLTQAGADSYSYNGDKLSSFTRFGQSPVSFTHDNWGRMTFDGESGETIAYNYLGLPRKITSTGGTLARYSYLANGSKSKAENGSGVGLVYRGSLIYKKAANGTLTFEGASIPEGKLVSGGVRYYVTDHLGSVKAVVNGMNGNLYEVNNYEPYGKRTANSSASSYLSNVPSGETIRDRFTGKEDQGPDFSTAYTDFGARQYSPALRRWLVPDPLSEKYYGISPYAYCAGDPVNLVDLNGASYSYFDINGNYLQTTKDNWWHNLWHGRTGRIVDDNGNVLQSFKFADPKHDVADLKAGIIDRVQLVQENEIISMLSKAGAFSEENKTFNVGSGYRYDYIKQEGRSGGKFDFSYNRVTGIPAHYPDVSFDPLSQPSKMLFIVDGVAHNHMNYGNFLYGAAGRALGLSLIELQLGAQWNSLAYPSSNGYRRQLDSRDDQRSIRMGVQHANTHAYRSMFYRATVEPLP